MSYTDFIRSEIAADALSDDRTTIDYDMGDRARWLGAWLNPFEDSSKYSRLGMQQRAKQQAEKDFNQANQGTRRIVTDLLQGTGIDTSNLTLSGNRTAADVKAELQSLQATGEAAQQYAALEGASLSDIKPGATTSSIVQLASGLRKENKEKAEEKATTKENNLWTRQTSREDFLTNQSNLREDRKDERARLDRLETQRMNMQNNQMTMELEYARMAQQDKYRMQDKKDKALMALLSGLGNLGAAFTI